MNPASYIEFYDRINLACNINLTQAMPHIRRLFQYRKELARRIIETDFNNEAYIELFKMNGEQIKQLLGL